MRSTAGAVAAGVIIARGLTRSLGTEPATLSDIAQRIAGGDLAGIAPLLTHTLLPISVPFRKTD
ncbi:hypothetical protein J2785_002772 [Burkholderia ambifaria]|nr:hypothetical protein [Burkholderia ambifaria]